MRSRHLAAFVFAAACGNLAPPPPPMTALPWLQGFEPSAIGEVATPAGAQRISDLMRTRVADDATAIELHADVAGDAAPETVLASYALGVVVADARGRVIATAPGLDPVGSADDLLAVAVGNGGAGPVIAVATQTGGHRESTVTIAVYRVGADHTLAQVFAGPIETHDGAATAAGALTFSPSGLVYRAPGTQRSRKIAWQ